MTEIASGLKRDRGNQNPEKRGRVAVSHYALMEVGLRVNCYRTSLIFNQRRELGIWEAKLVARQVNSVPKAVRWDDNRLLFCLDSFLG